MLCSRLLAGSILVDKEQVLLINTIEVYGRFKILDIHYERLSARDQISTPTIHSSYKSRPSVLIIKTEKSRKLGIGTTTFNALVTSSIRTDTSITPEISPTTFSFFPTDKTKLFLSEDFIMKANNILSRKEAYLPSTLDPASHLRQIRSYFNVKSSYIYGRFHSKFVNNYSVQPSTIFTLRDISFNDR